MSKELSLLNLEDEGICSALEIERNYSLSQAVQNDSLILYSESDLRSKIKDIAGDYAVDEETIYSIYYSLMMGNVILEGPPGTGKTSLAKDICQRLFNVKLEVVTANTEWTVYDLVGRKTLDLDEAGNERAVPEDGHITKSIVNCCKQISDSEDDTSKHQAVWLIIDELNRCKIDRAFGEFFTVLSGVCDQPLNLPHQFDHNKELHVPKRYRIVGTMNSQDKTFVNSFSQAFARRFNFVLVDIPRDKELLRREATLTTERAFVEVAKLTGFADGNELKESLASPDFDEAIAVIDEIVNLIRFGNGASKALVDIGTAQLIDTKKAFILRCTYDSKNLDTNLDWAISIKLLHQLDVDSIMEDLQHPFINAIPKRLKGTIKNVERIWRIYANAEE